MNSIFLILLTVAVIQSCNSQASFYTPPGFQGYPLLYGKHSTSVLTPVHQQYHVQDAYGQYSYGYSEPTSSKQEVRSVDGVTRGSYSYIDSDGQLQTVDYTADKDGFRVAATNLPKIPKQQIIRKFRQPISSISIPIATAAANTAIPAIPAVPAIPTVAPISADTISIDTPVASDTAIATDISDSHFESITAADRFDTAIHRADWLRLAGSTTANRKSATTAAHVHPMELSKSLANTSKISPTTALLLKHYPLPIHSHQVIITAPITHSIIHYPLEKSLISKYYSF